MEIYKKLLSHFGPQNWWPGDSPFEIAVGAVLTQNTNWGNVEAAIKNLKHARVLCPKKLHDMPNDDLAKLIKPAGYFNLKAKRLKNFINYLINFYDGKIENMLVKDTEILRRELLEVNGIGPETADSILLYACNKKIFVVDAYTKRIFERAGVIDKGLDYYEIQEFITKNFKGDLQDYNEFHALIVALGKDFCRPKPRCEKCALNNICLFFIDK